MPSSVGRAQHSLSGEAPARMGPGGSVAAQLSRRLLGLGIEGFEAGADLPAGASDERGLRGHALRREPLRQRRSDEPGPC